MAKGKGGYRNMEANLGGYAKKGYNHGAAMGMPGSGKSIKGAGNIVGTRLPGGGSPRKGKAKSSSGKSYGKPY